MTYYHVKPTDCCDVAPSDTFAYDALDRLTQMMHHDMEQFDPCYTEQFTYDTLGNRLTAVYRDGSSETYAHNPANEYTSIGGVSVYYDAAGNMTRDASDYVYDYDYENRLTKISHDSVTIATYAYDALNRRIEKHDPCDSGETTRYYYDGWRVLSEPRWVGIFDMMGPMKINRCCVTLFMATILMKC